MPPCFAPFPRLPNLRRARARATQLHSWLDTPSRMRSVAASMARWGYDLNGLPGGFVHSLTSHTVM